MEPRGGLCAMYVELCQAVPPKHYRHHATATVVIALTPRLLPTLTCALIALATARGNAGEAAIAAAATAGPLLANLNQTSPNNTTMAPPCQCSKKGVVRVVGKWLTFHAPHSIALLAMCLCDARPPSPPGGERKVCVAVEAAGSGMVLVPALEVRREINVGALKAKIEQFMIDATPGALQLALGHGNALFEDDGAQPFAAENIRDGGNMPPLVVWHSRLSNRDVLMMLYHEQWGSATAPLSDWEGVEVDAFSGHVTSLRPRISSGRWWCDYGPIIVQK